MEDIKNYSRHDLERWFEDQGIRRFRAGQIFKWLYLKQADTFEEMTDIGKGLRQVLENRFANPRLALEASEQSDDGTEKLLFRLSDGLFIESVLIPQKDHYTLCISSQAGCAMGCRFCLTSRLGFQRNLTCSEIISQVRDVKQRLSNRPVTGKATLSNIVFMGMGEPLANYEAVVKALSIITDGEFGLKFSTRRVTVSTCGLIPEMKKLGYETQVNLAVSLNGTTDDIRSMLMPINRKFSLKPLMDACRAYPLKPRNKITFEYILIKNINDSDDDARRLIKLLAPIKAKVNLIPFNEHIKSSWKRPSPETVSRFLQQLLDHGLTAITRKSMGDDISAACGQLKARAFVDTTSNSDNEIPEP